MKFIILVTILFIQTFGQCSRRTPTACLKYDNSCQIVNDTCETRPDNCEDINASNPNNCSGTKCYYDYLSKSCLPHLDFLSQKLRILDQRGEDQSEMEDDDYHHNQPEQNNSNQETQMNDHTHDTSSNTNNNSQDDITNNNQNNNNNQDQTTNNEQNQTTNNNSTSNYNQTSNNNQTIYNNQTNNSQNNDESDYNNYNSTDYNSNNIDNQTDNSTTLLPNSTLTTNTTQNPTQVANANNFGVVDLKIDFQELVNNNNQTQIQGIELVSGASLLAILISMQLIL